MNIFGKWKPPNESGLLVMNLLMRNRGDSAKGEIGAIGIRNIVKRFVSGYSMMCKHLTTVRQTDRKTI
jgi:hypothetical protein